LRLILVSLILAVTACSGASPTAEADHFIPGRVPLDWQGPDGNTVVLDAPDGLIVVDTGRSPAHAKAILDYAKERGKPIAAIVNTHWHLDHTTGNYDLRQVYPHARVYASTAIEGALVGFLGGNRANGDSMLADPKVPEGQKAQLLRGRYRLDHPDTLRPTVPVTKSATVSIAGRTLDIHLAKFAATEGDVWLYDPATKTAVVGDLVVGIVPFMDSACAEGWRKALEDIAAVPFVTLVPGHGDPMTRSDFERWKTAYGNFVDCGHSSAAKESCIDGWMRDAAPFIDAEHGDYVRDAAGYYLDTRLRSSPEEQQHYCKPLKAER
jgi:glyoxylase-like metal-dependent hydrolase (beta-lactamase superfamily II)